MRLDPLLLAFVSAVVVAAPAAANPLCPLALGDAELTAASLFESIDGAEYELAPESEGEGSLRLAWTLEASDAALRILCTYGNGATIETRLPEGSAVTCRSSVTHAGALDDALACDVAGR